MKTVSRLFFIILFLGLTGNLYGKSSDIEITLFYSPGCQECREIKDNFLIKLQEKFVGKLDIKTYDISILENYLKLVEFEEHYGVKENNPVIIFTIDRYFSGKNAILTELESYIESVITAKEKIGKEMTELKLTKQKLLNRFRSFNPFIIFSAGFIDGLNPCAFVTIVFLISFLSVSRKTRGEIFIIGLVFSFAALLAYLFLGLGFRGIMGRISTFNKISDLIYISAIFVVFVLSFICLYDAIVYTKYGNAGKIKIKLPEIILRKIHSVIRGNINTHPHHYIGVGGKGFLFSIFSAGFLVSLLESTCTGQIYLPTIMFMVKEPSMRTSSFLYLILYNVAFIIPLLAVILLTIFGVTLKRLNGLSKKNTFVAKIFMSVLFCVIGVLLILVK